jgi:cytochrome c-type biogenesis protein CcmH/NrfG
LSAVGQFDPATKQLEAARALTPGKQAVLFELGNVSLNKNDLSGALDKFRQAYEMDTDYTEARNLYSLVLLLSGKTAEAATVQEALGTAAYTDDRIATYFKNQKNYSMLLKSRENKAANNPTDVNSWSNLAEARYLVGDRVGAVEALRKAISLNPQVKEAAEATIKKIESGQVPF